MGTRASTGQEQRSVDNCPAHRGQALMDGLRFGSSPPRQILSLGMTDHKKGKRLGLLAQAAPSCFRRLARPRSDYRTWMPFPASFRPSARSERAPPPDTTPSRFERLLMRFRGLLACLLMPACVCICAAVRRCALGRVQSLPVRPYYRASMATTRDSNPCRHAKGTKAAALACDMG